MYFDYEVLYLLVLFTFLIGGTICLIIIELFNQAVLSTKNETLLSPIHCEVIHSVSKPIIFKQTVLLPSKYELKFMHPKHIDHIKQDALHSFVNSLIPSVTITEVESRQYNLAEFCMELHILQKEEQWKTQNK